MAVYNVNTFIRPISHKRTLQRIGIQSKQFPLEAIRRFKYFKSVHQTIISSFNDIKYDSLYHFVVMNRHIQFLKFLTTNKVFGLCFTHYSK